MMNRDRETEGGNERETAAGRRGVVCDGSVSSVCVVVDALTAMSISVLSMVPLPSTST